MDDDWLAVIGKQEDIIKKAAPIVQQFLADPNLSLSDALRLEGLISKGSGDLDATIERMAQDKVTKGLFHTAGTIQRIWGDLATDVKDRVEALQSRDPGEDAPRDS